ncbi:excinuclease [uncultured Photobacterium sp.]|uniref:excinuclease n=1 Tax=uncultured Photobacterium sp. TaxID=173973 RepID=UPI002605F6C7|nr:excinuclease [uncultured Photobacterium sp.]
MKKLLIALLINICIFPFNAFAKDDIASYSIQDALNLAHAKEKLGSDIKFYFGDQKFSKVKENFGEFKTNKKTNAFNKTDLEACQWVFLSAMITLKDRAVKEGGNAVVNIKSNYRDNLTSDRSTFQCGSGTFVSGVALVGDVVRL